MKIKNNTKATAYGCAVILISLLSSACTKATKQPVTSYQEAPKITQISVKRTPPEHFSGFYPRLALAAMERTKHQVTYDGSYKKIAYPWGDVEPNKGVCTDVIIRSYRNLGVDLQQVIHEDRVNHPSNYPDLLAGKQINTSIDHRRVKNMKKFFKSNAMAMPITKDPRHYRPGDLVTWKLPGDFDHIGIVVNQRSVKDPQRYMIVHNLAEGPIIEDLLFRFKIDGHYRYFGDKII